MYLKQIFFILCAIMFVSSELQVINEMYLNFFVQIESVKKSIDTLKLRMDVMELRNNSCQHNDVEEKFSKLIEIFGIVKKSQDDLKLQIEVGAKNSGSKYIDNEDQKINLEILKKSQDDSKVRMDTIEDNFRKKIDEMEIKYSNMLEQFNEVKNSEDNLKLEINRFQTKYGDLEIKYLNILEKCENAKKSDEALKSNVDVISDQISKLITKENTREKNLKFLLNPIFDARVDWLPEHCRTNKLPFDCKEATECTKKSGYYEILASKNLNHTLKAFCDEETADGDWLHILRRIDGSENFTRNWSDYVNGFGKADSEYWIGLENLYALTNYNGQQELYIYIENFNGVSRYARYDNFVIGNATEKYRLKSLGKNSGTAGEKLNNVVGMRFSTHDSDNDADATGNCADLRKGGFWFNNCGQINPTGIYYDGNSETKHKQGVFWYDFGGWDYSHKIMNFMIRRKK